MLNDNHANEFHGYLERIEFQATRLTHNPNYNLKLGDSIDLLQSKAVDLLTGIITFFNSALIHFNRCFFGKSSLSCLQLSFREGSKRSWRWGQRL